MLQMENYQGNIDYNLLEDSDIVNNLTTTATNKALSANQGKQLKSLIDNLLPDLSVGKEIPLPFNLWTGHKAYLKMVHTGAITANSYPTISHGIQNAEVCIIVPWLSIAYSNSGIWVNLPRPDKGGAEANQGVMVHASLKNISMSVGSDTSFDDSHVTVLFSKTTG